MYLPDISVTDHDFVRLEKLLAFENNFELRKELNRANVIDSTLAPPTLVTMESKVLYLNHYQEEKESILVYSECPLDQDLIVSVLSPVGTSLLGLKVGQKISFFIDGKEETLEVLEVSNRHLGYS